jgi:hypothetical protein
VPWKTLKPTHNNARLAVVNLAIVEKTPGAYFSYIFCGKNFGENSAQIFPLKNVGENWNYLRKNCFPRNSEENSAENYFPRKKMYEKSAPGGVV